MSNWSKSSLWIIGSTTAVAAVGLVLYVAFVGLNDSSAVVNLVLAIGTIGILGATWLALAKKESRPDSDTSNPVAQQPRVSQRASGKGRNYNAGRDIIIGDDDSREES